MLGALLTPALFTGSGEGQIRSGSVTRTELEDDLAQEPLAGDPPPDRGGNGSEAITGYTRPRLIRCVERLRSIEISLCSLLRGPFTLGRPDASLLAIEHLLDSGLTTYPGRRAELNRLRQELIPKVDAFLAGAGWQ